MERHYLLLCEKKFPVAVSFSTTCGGIDRNSHPTPMQNSLNSSAGKTSDYQLKYSLTD